ncbi:hypothetical protein FBU59_003122, partial [Linderina macrospora]
MSSRILSRARLSAARIAATQQLCRADLHSTAAAHGIFSRKVKELIANAQELPDPLTKADVPAVKRLTKRERRGGYKNGAGMHASVAIKAKNTEVAWGIWAFHTNRGQRNIDSRDGKAARRDLVDLIILLTESQTQQLSGSIFNPVDADKAVRQAETSSFRVVTALRQLFADSVRGVYDGKEANEEQKSESVTDLAQCGLGLGLESATDYERILDTVLAGVSSGVSNGNSPALTL